MGFDAANKMLIAHLPYNQVHAKHTLAAHTVALLDTPASIVLCPHQTHPCRSYIGPTIHIFAVLIVALLHTSLPLLLQPE